MNVIFQILIAVSFILSYIALPVCFGFINHFRKISTRQSTNHSAFCLYFILLSLALAYPHQLTFRPEELQQIFTGDSVKLILKFMIFGGSVSDHSLPDTQGNIYFTIALFLFSKLFMAYIWLCLADWGYVLAEKLSTKNPKRHEPLA